MDAENKIQKCSTCGDTFIAGVVNGKQFKTCRTCRDKKNKRKTQSETQETEKSQPPSDNHGLYHLLMNNLIIIIQTCRYVVQIS